MKRTVDLLTGPALSSARGAAVVQLLDADMRPVGIDSGTCPTMFEADLLLHAVRAGSLFLVLYADLATATRR